MTSVMYPGISLLDSTRNDFSK